MFIPRSGLFFLMAGLIGAGLSLTGCSMARVAAKGHLPPLTASEIEEVKSSFHPKRLAVVIGINLFQDGRWNALQYAVKDAQDLAAVLQDPRHGRFDEIRLLTAPEETTKAQILRVMRDIAQQNLSAQDTVVLYISAHGTLGRGPDGRLRQYLVAHDSRFDEVPATAIDLDDLKSEFNRLKSRKKVMVFAFCHSGQGKSRLDEILHSDLSRMKSSFFVKPLEAVSEATVVLTASAWGETASEDPSLQNDIYTHFLIDGIKGHDRNGDGAVTVSEAHDYAKEQTYYYTQGMQRPSMESAILGTDPIVLSGKVVRIGKPVLYDYSPRYQDMTIVIDGQAKGMLPTGVTVEPGVRRVTLIPGGSTQAIYDEAVTVREGQQLSLPILLYGYDQSLSFRIGYQGFLTREVERSVAHPLMTYGLVYDRQNLFTSRFGLRADFSYGQDRQMLRSDTAVLPAEVSQLAAGAALLYRYPTRWISLYAGPRLGGLYLVRDLEIEGSDREGSAAVTPGGMIGFHLRYKQHLSMSLEGAVNYANIQFGETDTHTAYYNLSWGLSVNF